MESGARFDNTQLFMGDARIVLGMLNHMRYQALNRAFGVSREQANVLTAVMALGAADAAYESARRVTGLRPGVSRGDAALGLLAVREVALGVAGPSVRQVPGLGALVVLAFFGALAAPRLRRAAQSARAAQQSLRAAEKRLRSERIRLRAEARQRGSQSTA